MNKGQIEAQQAFLKKEGLYTGKIDGVWGAASQNAMKGYSFRNSAGNEDGSWFSDPKRVPPGYALEDGYLVSLEAVEEPADPSTETPSETDSVRTRGRSGDNSDESADTETANAPAAPPENKSFVVDTGDKAPTQEQLDAIKADLASREPSLVPDAETPAAKKDETPAPEAKKSGDSFTVTQKGDKPKK